MCKDSKSGCLCNGHKERSGHRTSADNLMVAEEAVAMLSVAIHGNLRSAKRMVSLLQEILDLIEPSDLPAADL